VIKGAESALYGFNAVDGVINIVTIDPLDDPETLIQTRLGSQARRDGTVMVSRRLDDTVGLRLTAAADHADDSGMLTRRPADAAYREDPNRRSASLDAKMILPDDSILRVSAAHSDATGRTVAYNASFDARIVTNVASAGYTRESPLGRWSANLSFTGLDLPWVNSEPVGAQRDSDRELVASLSDLLKLSSADSLRLGTEYRHDSFTATLIQDGTVTGDLAAASAMWEHQWAPDLALVNALRYDHFQLGRSGPGGAVDPFPNRDFDRAVMGISANSAAVARLDDDDSLRVAFGRGLKLPSLANFAVPVRYQPAYASLLVVENPNLLPSTVYDTRAVWDHRIEDATLRLALFHDQTMKYVGPVAEPFGRQTLTAMAMTPGSVTNGMEIGLQRKVATGWSWGANYTLDRLHEHLDQGLRDGLPEHKLHLFLDYGLGDWQAGFTASYQSATKGVVLQSGRPPIAAVGTISAHSVLSPHLAWQATDNISIGLVADNLWPYQDSLLQRMETSYYLSATIRY
jgi:iron complex outermembrane receptor protein